ncbi:hypothetical protein THAOC_15069 [Thalassiosira oceanica]|uniref:Uncharacterized protein n=1 Tax=Thalassiosira oceanica TaxID=159749 RepID=K0T1D8_THAOC|nr:hypothetical protein THAOC_15069 [Thalassiosira oceanica]|eukprot:EJK64222.1 hypothetical protein THAOC_15069 [Thalassiosira oceanica]
MDYGVVRDEDDNESKPQIFIGAASNNSLDALIDARSQYVSGSVITFRVLVLSLETPIIRRVTTAKES